MIAKSILQKIFDQLFPAAQKIVEQDQAQHGPLLLSCRVKNGEVVDRRVMPLSGVKELDGLLIKATAKVIPADCVAVHIDEVWAKFALDGSDLPDPSKYEGVREMPGSKEGVMFNFFGRDWEATMFCEIKRNPSRLLRGEFITNVSSQGRLAPDVASNKEAG